jgi:hypothetical protein
MAERVYIETTVVSYLTARPSRDVVIAGHQQVTHEWWDTRRSNYELCVSQLVLDEAGAGDAQAAQERLLVLQPMLVLETTAEALELAKELLQAGALPAKAVDDALHIAVAATKAVPYLLTWNCRHLANAVMRPVNETVCKAKGFSAPIICPRGISGVQTMNDPIVDEVRRVRDAHAARFNYDLDAIFQDIKEREKTSGLKFVGGGRWSGRAERGAAADRGRRFGFSGFNAFRGGPGG